MYVVSVSVTEGDCLSQLTLHQWVWDGTLMLRFKSKLL